jgi:hypothetical protein
VRLGHDAHLVDHLGVVVVVRVRGREVVRLTDRLLDDPHAAQGEHLRLLVAREELDVVGPVRLADVVALANELRALLSRVHAVHHEALDRRPGRVPVAGRRQALRDQQ